MTSVVAERLLTEDEFLALPEDPQGRKLELFDGKVVALPHSGEEHNDCALRILLALATFTRANDLGTPRIDVGFKIRVNPDRIVAPDVAFLPDDAFGDGRDRTRSIPAAPLLAVEVKSQEDRERDIREKVQEYLDAGSARVWVVRPLRKTVTVHGRGGTVEVRAVGDTLSSDDAGFVVEGFELPVELVFTPLAKSRR